MFPLSLQFVRTEADVISGESPVKKLGEGGYPSFATIVCYLDCRSGVFDDDGNEMMRRRRR